MFGDGPGTRWDGLGRRGTTWDGLGRAGLPWDAAYGWVTGPMVSGWMLRPAQWLVLQGRNSAALLFGG